MRIISIGLMTVVATVVLASCTNELRHERLLPGSPSASPGFHYLLPRTRVIVLATYELKSCPNLKNAKTVPLVITQTASVTDTPVPDPSESYSLPLGPMTSGWKTTKFSATVYDDQTIHTVGVEIEDKSGAIIKSTIGTALSVARVMIGATTSERSSPLCTDDAYRALAILKGNSRKLRDPSLDANARAKLAAEITDAKGVLVFSQAINFDLTPERPSAVVTAESRELTTWFANPTLVGNSERVEKNKYQRVLQTGARIKSPPPKVLFPETLKGSGIVYREPAPVLVEICAGSCDDAEAESLATREIQAAQFGQYAVIPLNNGPFQKNNLVATFAKNGQLQELIYGSESSLEKLASTVSESAASVETFAQKKRALGEAEDKKANSAELDSITAKTALLKAKADKIEAERRLEGLHPGP